MNLLEIVARFVGDTSGIDKAIDATTAKAEAGGGRMSAAISKGISAGAKVLAAGGAVLFGAAAKGALELQNATISYQAATGATAAATEVAAGSITRLFQNNLTTMGEASAVLAALKTNIGLTGQAAEDAAGQVLDFAKVTGQDAVGAVSVLGDLTDGFSLTAAQQKGILDQLVASQQKYGGSVTDNQGALVKLAPALNAANLSYDDGIGLLNLFEASGIDASKAPAALTKALSKVKSPAELQRLIDDIRKTEDPFARAQKAADLFGAKAGPGLANALKNGGLEDFIVTADDAAGSLQTAADTIDSSIGNKITLAMNKAGGALAEFGSQMGPAITGLASLASLGLPMVTKLLGGLLPALAGAVPALATGIGGLFSAAVPLAMAALPLLLVAAVGAAIIFLINNPELVKQALDFISSIVRAIIGGAQALIGMLAGVAGRAIGAAGQAISTGAAAIVGFILSIPGRVASWVGSIVGQAAALVGRVAGAITGLVTTVVGLYLSIPGRILSWVSSIVGQAAALAGRLVSTISSLVGRIVGFFLGIPGRIAGIGFEIVRGIIGGMASLPGQLADVVRNAFANLRIDVGPFHISGSGVSIDLPKIELPSFDVGARYIPQDMLAVVHKGEAIIPADQNPWKPGEAAAAGAPLRQATTADPADRRPPLEVNVFNPAPEPASTSTKRELQKIMVFGGAG